MQAIERRRGAKSARRPAVKWFDGFTKVVLSVMLALLLCIFAAGKYMDAHKMEGTGTDDTVNTMASSRHHPFVELPGDAEVSAFSVANFFAGLIVGHHWEKLFGKGRGDDEDDGEEGGEAAGERRG